MGERSVHTHGRDPQTTRNSDTGGMGPGQGGRKTSGQDVCGDLRPGSMLPLPAEELARGLIMGQEPPVYHRARMEIINKELEHQRQMPMVPDKKKKKKKKGSKEPEEEWTEVQRTASSSHNNSKKELKRPAEAEQSKPRSPVQKEQRRWRR